MAWSAVLSLEGSVYKESSSSRNRSIHDDFSTVPSLVLMTPYNFPCLLSIKIDASFYFFPDDQKFEIETFEIVEFWFEKMKPDSIEDEYDECYKKSAGD